MSESTGPRIIRPVRATTAMDREGDMAAPTPDAPAAAGTPARPRPPIAPRGGSPVGPSGTGIGLVLLRCVLEAANRPEWRRLSRDIFLPDELAHFDFISRFYRRHGQLPPVGVLEENNLAMRQAPTAPFEYYLTRVVERARYNTLVEGHTPYVEAMRAQNVESAIAASQQTLSRLRQFQTSQDVFSLAETVEMVVAEYEVAERNPGIQGVSTGWPRLDEITGGLEPGDVGTVVARPGMGKSWLMIHSAMTNWYAGRSILFVTNEMTHVQIVRRMLGAASGINPTLIRRGQLSNEGRETFQATARNMNNGAPFHLISGSFNKTVPAVDAAIQEFTPEVVYIDASYLMHPSNKTSRMQPNELLANVMREIKEMAMARRVPLWQSVQLNRQAKQTRGQAPDLIHMHGSDEIGQLTTIAIGVQEGPPGFEQTSRRLNLMKVREGASAGEMTINFLFDPPNFDYLPTDENGAIARVDENPEADEWQA